MNKKDFKYIIKRILIGVGIILFVGFLNKCSVKADEKTDLYLNIFGYSPGLATSPMTTYGSPDYTFSMSNYNINVFNGDGSPDYFSLIFKDNNNNYLVLTNNSFRSFGVNIPANATFDKVNFTSNNYELYNNDTLLATSTDYPGFFSLSVFSQDIEFINDISFELVNGYSINSYYNEYYNDTIYNYNFNLYYYDDSTPTLTWYNVINYLYNNFELVHTSTDMEINGTSIDIPPVPDYYSQLNLQGYSGVYFVPKNYSTIPTTTINSDIVVIPFNYYYKGSFKSGYFPLNNTSIIVSTFENENDLDNLSYTESWFPYSENDDGTGYQYYSYIIYNNDVSYDSSIYYDSRYFDYYLIENMESYNIDITFLNKNNESENLNIIFDRNFQQIWELGLTNSFDTINPENKGLSNYISSIVSIIKRPFKFLTDIRDNTCSNFTAPIPFIGDSISFPCMSSIYHDVLGDFYDVFSLLINGVVIYYCVIKNLKVMKDNLDSERNILEVVDL